MKIDYNQWADCTFLSRWLSTRTSYCVVHWLVATDASAKCIEFFCFHPILTFACPEPLISAYRPAYYRLVQMVSFDWNIIINFTPSSSCTLFADTKHVTNLILISSQYKLQSIYLFILEFFNILLLWVFFCQLNKFFINTIQ